MKLISVLLFSLLLSQNSFSLIKVGDQGLCTELTTIQQNNQEILKNTCDSDNKSGLVLIDFVSATCTYCIGSLPEVAHFAQEMQGQLTIRQIGIDRNSDLLREYWKEHQQYMVFDLALDSQRTMKNAYQVTAVPTHVLIDKNKKVLFVNVGALGEKEYEQVRKIVRSQNE